MSGATLEDRALAALDRITGHPPAFDPTPQRRARWLAAVAKLAAAAADFAALAAEADYDALLEAGDIGDSLLVDRASEASRTVVAAQQTIGGVEYFDMRDGWEGYGRDLASGESRGEEGQRLLVTIAERLEAAYGF